MIRRVAPLPLLVLCLCIAASEARAADTLESIELSGPVDNRIDLVVVGDGYTTAEAELFRQHADALLSGLFSVPPWSAYRGAFNLYRVVTESPESGADHPSQNTYVDTYFDAEFDCFGIERLLCANETMVIAVVSGLLPEVDQIVLIVNDTEYGGSGGTISIVSANSYSVEILTHELGHSFAGLADEYTDPFPAITPDDPEPNVDFDSTFDQIKWNPWIEAGTPLPTSLGDAVDDYHPVGAYEGARYLDSGIYRPAPHCMMQSLEYDYCEVCREAMVLSVYGLVEPVDDATPVSSIVDVDLGDPSTHPVRFAVAPLDIGSAGGLMVSWLIDGWEASQDAELALDPVAIGLEPGEYELTVVVTDDGPWVRTDPDDLLTFERSWTLRVTGTPIDAGVVAPDGGTVADAGTDNNDDHGGCSCRATGAEGSPLSLLLVVLVWLRRRRRR